MMLTASSLRVLADAAIVVNARANLEAAYKIMDQESRKGLGSVVLRFGPFALPPGGTQTDELTGYLVELAANGFILTNTVDVLGYTYLVVSW